MTWGLAYAILAGLWIAASVGGGALLALLARRMQPGLSFRKLWVFYGLLLGVGVAVVMAAGLV